MSVRKARKNVEVRDWFTIQSIKVYYVLFTKGNNNKK